MILIAVVQKRTPRPFCAFSAQTAHVRKCAPHTGTHAIAKNDIAAKKSGIVEKRSRMASGERRECISTQHRF